jgi:hypothetical protein
LGKNRFFAGLAIFTLSLGIGIETAVFSIVDGVIISPLPYRDSERLVSVSETNPRNGQQELLVSLPTFLDWQQQQRSFEDLAAYNEDSYVLTTQEGVEKVEGASVSANFFTVLGVSPILSVRYSEKPSHLTGIRFIWGPSLS